MGHGALKLHRATKSRLSSRAAGIFLVLGPAWRRNPVFLLVVHDPSCLLAGVLGCFRGIPHHPWCLEQLLWEGRFGLGTPGGSAGASNTLAWALSSLWSLFPNCSFLRKDTMRWWDEFCLLVPLLWDRDTGLSTHPQNSSVSPREITESQSG